MAGGNPLAPPGGGLPGGGLPGGGGAPVGGGPVPQPGAGGGRQPQLGRAPFNGAGAPIFAPSPPNQPSNGANGLAVPPSKQGMPFAPVHQALSQSKAAFETNMKATKILDHFRVELDQLMEKGDVVRPEDVIEAAGRLVGHGIGAAQLATVMSDMPAQGGEGLASWVRMHDVTITNAERALARETTLLQHQMGMNAIKSIAASHLTHVGVQSPEQASTASQSPLPSDGGNALGGSPPGGDEGVGNV